MEMIASVCACSLLTYFSTALRSEEFNKYDEKDRSALRSLIKLICKHTAQHEEFLNNAAQTMQDQQEQQKSQAAIQAFMSYLQDSTPADESFEAFVKVSDPCRGTELPGPAITALGLHRLCALGCVAKKIKDAVNTTEIGHMQALKQSIKVADAIDDFASTVDDLQKQSSTCHKFLTVAKASEMVLSSLDEAKDIDSASSAKSSDILSLCRRMVPYSR